jgi:hypothetical protein
MVEAVRREPFGSSVGRSRTDTRFETALSLVADRQLEWLQIYDFFCCGVLVS